MQIRCVEILLKIIPMWKMLNSGKYKLIGVHMLWNSYAACIPLRINIVDFPQLLPSICSCVLTDLLGNSNKPHQVCWPPNPQAQRCPLPSAARCSCIHAGRGSSAAALTALETAGCHDYQTDPMSHQAPGDWKLREKILIESNTNKFWQTRRYCC